MGFRITGTTLYDAVHPACPTMRRVSMVCVVLNAAVFTVLCADPFLRADAWFVVKNILMPCSAGNCSMELFFTLRGAADHAQPVQKLLFLLNAAWLDLDLRLDAAIGFCFLVLTFLWIVRAQQFAYRRGGLAQPMQFAPVAACTLFSLNAPVIYAWPLVTMGFMGTFLAIWLCTMANRVLAGDDRRAWPLSLSALLVLLAGDDIGKVGVLAVIISCALPSVDKNMRRRSALVVVMLMAGLLTYQLFRANVDVYLPTNRNDISVAAIVDFYSSDWLRAPYVILAALSNGVLLKSHLTRLVNDYAALAQVVMGLFIAFCFARAVTIHIQRRMWERTVVPLFLMLFSMGMIAGIILYRVPELGAEYINQPRYARPLGIGVVGALWILMDVARTEPSTHEVRPRARVAVALAAVLVVAFIYTAIVGWSQAPYIRLSQYRQAAAIVSFSGNARGPCIMSGPLCRMDKKDREAVLGFLRDRRLNMFSILGDRIHLPATERR